MSGEVTNADGTNVIREGPGHPSSSRKLKSNPHAADRKYQSYGGCDASCMDLDLPEGATSPPPPCNCNRKLLLGETLL